VHAKDQHRDAKGIFSTTYLVKEIMTPMLGGEDRDPTETTYLLTVKNNYAGNGTYLKECGKVTKLPVETSAKTKF
jgi:hypothetical protein